MAKSENGKKREIDFSAVLAAAVHDMKNSLSLLIQSVETLGKHVPESLSEAHEDISRTHYEASRLNTNLVQLLSLYRADIEQLPTTIDEYSVEDLLADIASSNRYYCQQQKIELEIHVEDDIFWFLDSELVYLLLNDALVNALRYGKQRVIVSADCQEIDGHEFLHITIEDDGMGYPEAMLKDSVSELSPANVKNGRTGLGLFFARLIAHAHENQGNRGEISLSNGGRLGGSVFSVNLP
jgi:K+-sensing histidine kinase KdpD